jgi:SAM-dependent methyltransferase
MREVSHIAGDDREPLSARQRAVVQTVRAALSGQPHRHVILTGANGSAFADELMAATEPHQPGGDAAVIHLRTTDPPTPATPTRMPARPRHTDHHTDQAPIADIIIDCHDPRWPVIQHMNPRLTYPAGAQLRETQAFFALRAADWDARFGRDQPAYEAAVTEARIPAGATVADIGCGTGRALPALRDAVGATGHVLAVDVTPEMLEAVRAAGRDAHAHLLRADATRLPLPDASLDAVFAAGLIPHVRDPRDTLAELARVTRTGGRLILFHPSGRAELAARHRRTLHPDEPLADEPLARLLAATGWRRTSYDDDPERFLALATRIDLTP